MQVVAETSDGYEAVRLARALHPQVAILDIALPGLNGLDAATEILREDPAVIVLLLRVEDDKTVSDALPDGASAYVLRNQSATDLVQAIEGASRGGIYLSPGLSRVVAEARMPNAAPSPGLLTAREREILRLVAEGQSTKEIADVLSISVKTVETHRLRIMNKLEIHDIPGLVRYAIRRELVKL